MLTPRPSPLPCPEAAITLSRQQRWWWSASRPGQGQPQVSWILGSLGHFVRAEKIGKDDSYWSAFLSLLLSLPGYARVWDWEREIL